MDRTLTKLEVVSLIRQGKAIVIHDGNVLDLTHWIKFHPGGDTAIFHMIGRDATDEMNVYHGEDTIKTFYKWKVGRVEQEVWENLLPPIQGADYADMSANSSQSTLVEGVQPKGMGFPTGPVEPRVKQNVNLTKANIDQLLPVGGKIVDPQLQLNSFDNQLTKDDLDQIPDLDYATQEKLRNEYHQLHRELELAQLFDCDYWNYYREIFKICTLFLWSFNFFHINWLAVSALLMGMAWHQMTFIAHDAGHVLISHNYQVDNTFGMVVALYFGGLSLGWWKRNHNVHHLITNDPVHDPDIQHLPFFAVLVQLLQLVYSTYYQRELTFDKAAAFLIPYQHYLYYPILCFGRFNLYRLLWEHLLLAKGPRKGRAAWFRPFEIVGLSFFFFWFFYLLVFRSIEGGWNRFNYVMISHIATMLVHVQITLSHFAMLTADLGVSELFPSRQLRTTMDVDCPEWLDFFHGGLQFQAIHHLFPRMPRHNLRRAQPYVLDFCNKVGLNYSIYGFAKGNGIVLDKLEQIAQQARILGEATKRYNGDIY